MLPNDLSSESASLPPIVAVYRRHTLPEALPTRRAAGVAEYDVAADDCLVVVVVAIVVDAVATSLE